MSFCCNRGRIAGLWYLLLMLLGTLRPIYIPSKLFVAENATGTVSNIAAHERLFRLGIADDLLAALVLVLLLTTPRGLSRTSDGVSITQMGPKHFR